MIMKMSLVFNIEYFSQFFIKFKDQGQFWNLLVMRILKLLLIFETDEELTEIYIKYCGMDSLKCRWHYCYLLTL